MADAAPILPFVQRLAVPDPATRRGALLAILRELGVPVLRYCDEIAGRTPENIVVRLGQGAPRLVLAAHYDSAPGSSGANDNAAGVAILLSLLREYRQHPPALPCDIVFFDLEEAGGWGSRAYVERFATEHILAMLNLDVCGFGDTILLGPRHSCEEWPLQAAVDTAVQRGAGRVRVVRHLPLGDDASFAAVGIPSLSVTIAPEADVEPLLEAVPLMRQLRPAARMPAVAETIHNGPRDSVDVVEEAAMQAVRACVRGMVAVLSQAYSG
ncbi:Zn-dependent exopeptidase M28 [Chloroflexia bacterium SDU3-3]|nr:Zn-dependent exopeptidase M28 [Chloroflexia bacterium SDU3-3]